MHKKKKQEIKQRNQRNQLRNTKAISMFISYTPYFTILYQTANKPSNHSINQSISIKTNTEREKERDVERQTTNEEEEPKANQTRHEETFGGKIGIQGWEQVDRSITQYIIIAQGRDHMMYVLLLLHPLHTLHCTHHITKLYYIILQERGREERRGEGRIRIGIGRLLGAFSYIHTVHTVHTTYCYYSMHIRQQYQYQY